MTKPHPAQGLHWQSKRQPAAQIIVGNASVNSRRKVIVGNASVNSRRKVIVGNASVNSRRKVIVGNASVNRRCKVIIGRALRQQAGVAEPKQCEGSRPLARVVAV